MSDLSNVFCEYSEEKLSSYKNVLHSPSGSLPYHQGRDVIGIDIQYCFLTSTQIPGMASRHIASCMQSNMAVLYWGAAIVLSQPLGERFGLTIEIWSTDNDSTGSGHQVCCIPWVQMGTFNKEISFLCGLKLFALKIFWGEYLQSSLHLMLQIWWKPLLWKMCQ